MEAEALEVLSDGGRVTGLRYRDRAGQVHQVRARLTVAADGRDSGLRRSAGLRPVEFGVPVDVLWFRLPRRPTDPPTFGRLAPRHLLVLIDRGAYWQIAHVIPKAAGPEPHQADLEGLRASVAELVPFLADRVGELRGWDDVRRLRVQVDRLRRWFRPGLLCIGDAAHAMSPIGGVGINLAIQDAVAAADVLAGPLKTGVLRPRHLKAVQRRREWPTRLVRWVQVLAERWVVSGALDASETFRLSILLRFLLRTPFLRDLFARLVAFGAWPVHARVNTGDASACPSGSLNPKVATYA
jgi:2-polyprenyl-6-methoxyphenol hydroxylase-like FAD-dependent oxidoreductase